MRDEFELPPSTVYAEIDENGVILNTAIFEDTKTPEDLGLATTWVVYVPEELPNDVPPLKNWVKDENGIWNPPADKPYPEDHTLDGNSPWYWKDPDGTGDGDWALIEEAES
tara:strand:- start:59 stop:391 length:333 start_codon:yes stop_codon:yes gene_type:complete